MHFEEEKNIPTFHLHLLNCNNLTNIFDNKYINKLNVKDVPNIYENLTRTRLVFYSYGFNNSMEKRWEYLALILFTTVAFKVQLIFWNLKINISINGPSERISSLIPNASKIERNDDTFELKTVNRKLTFNLNIFELCRCRL